MFRGDSLSTIRFNTWTAHDLAMRGGGSSPGLYHSLRLSYDYVMLNSRHSGEMSSQRRTASDGHDSIEQSNEQCLSFNLRPPFVSV